MTHKQSPIFLILAGGFATRLWPLSEHRAKPLLLIDGKTILAHQLEKIPLEAEIILLTNQKFAADFQSELTKLGRINQTKIFLEDSYADGEKLGALGAVATAIKTYNIQQNIIVFAGDNILPDLSIENLQTESNQSVIAIREVADFHQAKKFGVVELENSNRTVETKYLSSDSKKNALREPPCIAKQTIKSFEEKPHNPKSKLVSTGFMSFGVELLPHVISYAKESPDALGGIFPYLIAKNIKISATQVGGEWYDIGSFDQYLAAHEVLQKQNVIKHKNVLDQNNTLSGKIFIGEDCKITNCILHDVIVYPGTKIDNCIISKSVIDTDCHLSGIDLNQKLIRSGTEFLR
jgi:glucose-1-phosphate thymidylyltransferase